MHLQKRQTDILTAVKSRGACTIVELAEQLNVSDETIRRNVKPLVEQGLVDKVHGGIMLSESLQSEPPFQRRMAAHREEKLAISALLARIVENGDSLMIDTGSTTAYVARALCEHQNLSVVTNCTEIARTLVRQSSNSVHIAGGELRADDWATFGSAAISFVRQFRVRYAILSIGAISSDGEFMDFHLDEAELSRAVIEQASTTIVVADHSKFGNRAFVKVCSSQQVDIIVTDRNPPPAMQAIFADAGISLLTPDKHN